MGLVPFFYGKSTIFGIIEYRKGCGHRYAHDVPLVTLILNIWVRGFNFKCELGTQTDGLFALNSIDAYTSRHTLPCQGFNNMKRCGHM